MEVSKCRKISIKTKNCKTFDEAQTVSRLKEIRQPSPTHLSPYKILLRLWNYVFLTDTYRNIQTQTYAFKVFQECNSWASSNSAVQTLFSDTKQKKVCRKIYNFREIFGCVVGAYYFCCQVR